MVNRTGTMFVNSGVGEFLGDLLDLLIDIVGHVVFEAIGEGLRLWLTPSAV